jgi:peptidyl-prolyl cis-trans isomerase C
MKNIIGKSWIAVFVLFIFIFVSGCSNNGNKNEASVGANQIQNSPSGLPVSGAAPAVQPNPGDAAVSVDGKILKKSELEKDIKEKFNTLKDKIPAEKQNEFKENLKKQLLEVFIIKTILGNEVEKRKIEASPQEVQALTDKIKAGIPPSKKIEDFLKENKVTKEDLILAVKIEKFRDMEIGQKAKPTQKEISKFYNDNREKLFVEPESVHVRHILVTVGKDDTEKVKQEKKAKIEDLRKQLLSGGNFAELARKNSDCPSKEVGGDLSFIKRGQTVKIFEDAAFSQKVNVIGPVIKTEYGYHIIEVLDRKPAKKVTLDEAKGKISIYLEQQKKGQIFSDILKNLKEKAKIILY